MWEDSEVYGAVLVKNKFTVHDYVGCHPNDIYNIGSFVSGKYDGYGKIIGQEKNIVLKDRENTKNGFDYIPLVMCHKTIYDNMLKNKISYYEAFEYPTPTYVDITIEEYANRVVERIFRPYIKNGYNIQPENIKGRSFGRICSWLYYKNHMSPLSVSPNNSINEEVQLYRRSLELCGMLSLLGKPLTHMGTIHGDEENFNIFRQLHQDMDKLMKQRENYFNS